MPAAKGKTVYSETISGSARNYGWSVKFDFSDGFLGIDQSKDEQGMARVLLSPGQVEALLRFLRVAGK